MNEEQNTESLKKQLRKKLAPPGANPADVLKLIKASVSIGFICVMLLISYVQGKILGII